MDGIRTARATIVSVLGGACLLATAAAWACVNGSDTARIAGEPFPSIEKLLSGDFTVELRVESAERAKEFAAEPLESLNPGDYDDWAIALDRLGRHDEAIELMRVKNEKWPTEGQYETHANWGAFLTHAERWEEALPHVERAIEINPEAHGGLEVYHLLLVRYVVECTRNGATPRVAAQTSARFDAFVIRERNASESVDAEMKRAIRGLGEIIRFGMDSPWLFEAYGDLLASRPTQNRVEEVRKSRLAAMAYFRAGFSAKDAAAKKFYNDRADATLGGVLSPSAVRSELTLALRERQTRRDLAEWRADKSWRWPTSIDEALAMTVLGIRASGWLSIPAALAMFVLARGIWRGQDSDQP